MYAGVLPYSHAYQQNPPSISVQAVGRRLFNPPFLLPVPQACRSQSPNLPDHFFCVRCLLPLPNPQSCDHPKLLPTPYRLTRRHDLCDTTPFAIACPGRWMLHTVAKAFIQNLERNVMEGVSFLGSRLSPNSQAASLCSRNMISLP